MLSSQYKFLFVHVPKTGGNSIQLALACFADDEIAKTQPHHDGKDRFEVRNPRLRTHKHSTVEEYSQKLGSKFFNRLRVISGIRNPWDRFVSFFFSPHRGDISWSPNRFKKFLREMKPAEYYLKCPGYADPFGRVDHFIRFEHIEADFQRTCELLDLGIVKLPKANLGLSHSSYRDYYSERTARFVGELCKREIQKFGYEF